jgi:hypothetical protein
VLVKFADDGELNIDLEIWQGYVGWVAGLEDSRGQEGYSNTTNCRFAANIARITYLRVVGPIPELALLSCVVTVPFWQDVAALLRVVQSPM